MEIRPIQYSINTKSNEHKHYLQAEGAVDTTGLVKPLPGKGHLIHDDLISGPKYFFKDIAYDMKSLKNGFNGTANDHQLGRLNDVGLQLGGVGIATYLASKTTNPKARIMEYVGLASFLTAMNVYPKIAINLPSRVIHGYDIGKWYIDDQGRKKSVNQDSNYRPMDLYRGERSDEDLDKIADDMGIPRNIKNRHELTKEQTRKLSTQNNTLWMLTAGFATPVLTALACYGLENYVISPQLEKARNNKYNKLITEILQTTKSMEEKLNASDISNNDLSNKINKILSGYTDKGLPLEEFDNIVEILTKDVGNNTAEGLKEDLQKLTTDYIQIDREISDKMLNSSKELIKGSKKAALEEILIPTKEELDTIINKVVPNADLAKGATTSPENITEIKQQLYDLINQKIENSNTKLPKKRLTALRNTIIKQMADTLESHKVKVVPKENFNSITNAAKILGEFKANKRILDKCESFKFEDAPETVLARSYGKFEKTLLKELGFTMDELKKMRESEEFTTKILNEKISELVQDEAKYKKVVNSLTKVISEMEVNLNGFDENKSFILDLVNATENNYNNTAKRLANLGGFENTITRLVNNQDISALGNSVSSRQELFDLFDGVIENKWKLGAEDNAWEAAKYNYSGAGSSKHLDISRMIERYQGVKNSFNRILHTFEVYKRTIDPDTFLKTLGGLTNGHQPLSRTDVDYIQSIIKKGRMTLLTATSGDNILKLDTVNNPIFYKDIINSMWTPEFSPNPNDFFSTKAKGFVTDEFKNVLSDSKAETGNLLERFQTYITRFRNIVANSELDFMKKSHIIDGRLKNSYRIQDRTPEAIFNLVAQSPVDLVRGASKRQYGTKKWFKMVAATATAVFGVTLLAQTGFGKIRNPHNIKKQVNNETN